MLSKWQLRLRMILLLSIVLVSFSCTSEPQAPLRIGTSVWPGYEPLHLASEMGYFDKMPIKLVEYTSASEVIRAFRNGAIDGALLTLDEVILLAETGLDVKAVLVLDVSHGGDVVLAKPERKTLRDLKGRKIGVETTALGAYVLTPALQRSGMTVSDVTVVPVEIGEHQRAYERGIVDAVVTFEPVKTKILNMGARKLFDSSQIPGEIVDILVIRGDFLKKNRGQIEGVLKGWFRALNYMKENPAKAAGIMAKREQISAGEFELSLEGLRIPDIKENRAMLGGTSPGLRKPAELLIKVMIGNQLIRKEVDTGALLCGKYLEDVVQ